MTLRSKIRSSLRSFCLKVSGETLPLRRPLRVLSRKVSSPIYNSIYILSDLDFHIKRDYLYLWGYIDNFYNFRILIPAAQSSSFRDRCLHILRPLTDLPVTRIDEKNLDMANDIIICTFQGLLEKAQSASGTDCDALTSRFLDMLHFLVDVK